jgi:phage terminase large subunit-like protein
LTQLQLPSYLSQQGKLYRLNKARKPFDVATDIVTWAQDNFFIPETSDHRLTIAPYQQRALNEAMRVDANGNFVYSTVVWSDLKKGIKSVLGACRGLYAALTKEWSTVYVIANDLKQADSRVAYYMRRAVELNPELKRRCKVNRYLIEFDNHSRIEAIPIDPSGEAGSNADLLIFSELWGWKHDSAQRMWTEMTLSPTKFGKSQRWVETYAGFVGESPILEMLHDTAVVNGERIDDDIELYRSGSILALWNTKPRLEWQTPEYYASEAAILPPSEFNRVHRNQWAQSSEGFVPSEWWDACKVDLPAFSRNTPMVIGIDAAVTSDLFAMVGVSRVKGTTYVRYVKTWRAPQGGKIDFDEPRQELERLAREYNVECACYDPYQMAMFAGLVTQRGLVYMQEFTQAGRRLESDKALYDAIRQRTIAHDGDALLREHVMNANREVAPQDNKLRIVKRQESMKIDALVALSMCHHTIVELEIN